MIPIKGWLLRPLCITSHHRYLPCFQRESEKVLADQHHDEDHALLQDGASDQRTSLHFHRSRTSFHVSCFLREAMIVLIGDTMLVA